MPVLSRFHHIEWHGGRDWAGNDQLMDLITGFSYRPVDLPTGVGNLGLRIVEGVEETTESGGSGNSTASV